MTDFFERASREVDEEAAQIAAQQEELRQREQRSRAFGASLLQVASVVGAALQAANIGTDICVFTVCRLRRKKLFSRAVSETHVSDVRTCGWQFADSWSERTDYDGDRELRARGAFIDRQSLNIQHYGLTSTLRGAGAPYVSGGVKYIHVNQCEIFPKMAAFGPTHEELMKGLVRLARTHAIDVSGALG